MLNSEKEARLHIVEMMRQDSAGELQSARNHAPYSKNAYMLAQFNEEIYILKEFVTWLDRRKEEIENDN